MKPKILFISGLIMSTVAVALLVVSGFNFQDLKPANWKNLRTVYAASGDTITGTETITKPRVLTYNCLYGGDGAVGGMNGKVRLYLGPAEIQRSMVLKNSAGVILSVWNEIYSVPDNKWANTNTGSPAGAFSTFSDSNWQAKTATTITFTGGTINYLSGGSTTCQNYSSGIISTSGLYGASASSSISAAGSSLPLQWNVTGTFTQ